MRSYHLNLAASVFSGGISVLGLVFGSAPVVTTMRYPE